MDGEAWILVLFLIIASTALWTICCILFEALHSRFFGFGKLQISDILSFPSLQISLVLKYTLSLPVLSLFVLISCRNGFSPCHCGYSRWLRSSLGSNSVLQCSRIYCILPIVRAQNNRAFADIIFLRSQTLWLENQDSFLLLGSTNCISGDIYFFSFPGFDIFTCPHTNFASP